MQQNSMRVLGIDPGYDRLGLAIIEKGLRSKEVLLDSTCLESNRESQYGDRLQEVGQAVLSYVRKWKPDALAIETLYMSTNQKTAFKVAESRGVVLYCANSMGITVYEYTPQQVKMAITGYGKSSKEQVMDMIPRLIVLGDKKRRLDDEFDAIAVALTGIVCIRQK
jgi:crossover junction endodeoxyribonuclease RuvC